MTCGFALSIKIVLNTSTSVHFACLIISFVLHVENDVRSVSYGAGNERRFNTTTTNRDGTHQAACSQLFNSGSLLQKKSLPPICRPVAMIMPMI